MSNFATGGSFEAQTLSVVMAQFESISCQTREEVEKNLDLVLSYMDKASCMFCGFDLIVFQENVLQGAHPTGIANVLLTEEDPIIKRVQEKSKYLQAWTILPVIIAGEKGLENTSFMINDKGEIVHRYIKMIPWTPAEPTYPGREIPVTPGPKGSRIATILCYDGDFSEIWREAAFNGANVIIRSSHMPTFYRDRCRLSTRAGAYFNTSYVIGVNAVGADEAGTYFGCSMAIDPDGIVLTEAPEGIPALTKVDIYPAIIDERRRKSGTLNLLRHFRNRGCSCPALGGKGDTDITYNAYNSGKEVKFR